MSLRSRVATWWRAVSERDDVDRQVQEELQFHLESYAEDLMRSGVPREQAMRKARAELGSLAAGREKCRAAWGLRWVDETAAICAMRCGCCARAPDLLRLRWDLWRWESARTRRSSRWRNTCCWTGWMSRIRNSCACSI